MSYFRITCSNQTNSNTKSIVVTTQGSTSYKDNIACVFGLKQLNSILEIKPEPVSNIKDNIFRGLSGNVVESEESSNIEDIEIDLSEDSNDAENGDIKNSQDSICSSQKSQGYKNVPNPVQFTGFISSCAHGSGRSSSDRQFYYVNSRPCEPTKIMKLINEIYRQYNPNQYPFVFLNVVMERTSVDVNVTPDKRKIFLIKEKQVLDIMKTSLLKLFESIPRTLKVEPSNNFVSGGVDNIKADLEQPRLFHSFLQQFSTKSKENSSDSVNNTKIEKQELKRKSTTMLQFVSCKSMRTEDNKNNIDFVKDQDEIKDKIKTYENDDDNSKQISNENTDISSMSSRSNSIHEISACKESEIEYDAHNIIYLENTDSLPNTQVRKICDVIIEKEYSINCKTKHTPLKANVTKNNHEKLGNKTKIVTDKEDIGKYNRKSVNIKISLEDVQKLTDIYNKGNIRSVPERVRFRTEINPVHNKKCEEELSREISKDSFKEMRVIGQFNLGFIITQLGDDLFIIDQHATDEIYNFETLQKTTELTNQKLVM